MKILFVLDSLSSKSGANVNIAIAIAKQLQKRGHKVSVLSKSDCKRVVSSKVMKEFNGVYMLKSDKFDICPLIQFNVDENSSNKKQMIWLFKHPWILLKGIDIVLFNAYFTKREFSREITRICKNKNIDAIIAVTAPYYLAEALSMTSTEAIKAVYQLDPYSNNYTFSKLTKFLRKKVENKVIKNLDVLFATNFVKEDLISTNIITEESKVIEANLPGIKVDEVPINSQVLLVKNENTVQCLFAGKFYKKIRNPRYLLELFDKLPSNYVLNIAGHGCENIIESYKSKLGYRLIHHGFIGKSEVEQLIRKADVLINVDNTIKNQMPSKIVDYICTGKKILNICTDSTCLSKRVLYDYPNGLSIFDNTDSIDNNVKKVIAFIDEPLKSFTSKQILKTYKQYTDEYVSDIIAVTIEKILKKRKKIR